MANIKTSPRKIISNRVNGVLKSYDTFHTSLRNNLDEVSKEEFLEMMNYLKTNVEKKTQELNELYDEKSKPFTLQ